MDNIFRAYFVANGTSLIALTDRRIEKYALAQASDGRLLPQLLWSTQVADCVNIVEAPQSQRLIATDTSGTHWGLCVATGERLWQSEPLGEGDPAALVLDAQSRERFVFATWSGVLQQLDPETGKHLVPPQSFLSQLRGLQPASQTQQILVTALIPAKSDNDPVGEVLSLIDLETLQMRQVSAPGFSRGIIPSPDGKKAAFVTLVDDPGGKRFHRSEHWEIRDLATGKTVCETVFEPKQFLSRNAVWSPDGAYIATAEGGRHILISAKTLLCCGMVEGEGAERPAFHPAGTHVCLCRGQNTQILPISDFRTSD